MADQPSFMQQQAVAEAKKSSGGGLFSSSSKPKPGDAQAEASKNVSSLTNSVNDLNRRLRVLEERYNNLQKKTQITEENMLSSFKKANSTITTFHDDINEFKKKIKLNDERTELIIKELKLTAKKEDFIVLNRYLELWDPVKFVTQSEIDRIVDQKIQVRLAGLGLNPDTGKVLGLDDKIVK